MLCCQAREQETPEKSGSWLHWPDDLGDTTMSRSYPRIKDLSSIHSVNIKRICLDLYIFDEIGIEDPTAESRDLAEKVLRC